MKGDIETMAAGIANNAVWHIPESHQWSGEFAGKDVIMGRFQTMMEQGYRTIIDEIHDLVGNDEHVVALVRFTAASPTGSASQSSVWVMHIRDGKATEFWAINEDQAALDAIMGPERPGGHGGRGSHWRRSTNDTSELCGRSPGLRLSTLPAHQR